MQKHTLRALLSPRFQDELGIIRRHAIALWKTPQHRTFTDHQPEGHSERIILKLDALTAELGDSGEQLSSEEAYIVLAAAYLHDIGMQAENPKYGTPDEIRDRHHLISQEMIFGSISNPSESPVLGVGAEFADEIALVSAAHRKLDLSESLFDDRDKAGGVLRLRLLSALLRLADELDRDYQRVNIDLLKTMQVSQTSRLHWWRCHYIGAVSVRDSVITATCEVPDEDYEFLFKLSVERELNQELGKVQEFLWPPIRLRVAPVKTVISGIKQRMSESDFAALSRETEQILSRSSQETFAEISRMREREERQARTISEEAKRQSGAEPPDIERAIALHQKAAQLYFQMGRMQSVADELGQLAQLHLKQSDKIAAADCYEQLGQLYLSRDEVFLSLAKFRRAVELTPRCDEADAAPNFRYLRRSLLTVIPTALMGEFDSLTNYLDEVAQFLEGQPFTVEFGRLFFASMLLFWSLQGEWQNAFSWAREWTDFEDRVWQHTLEEHRSAGPYARAFYQGSLCASYAGEHDVAMQWIERAFAIHGEATSTDAGHKFALHGRRGYIRARRDEWRAATDDYVIALEGAEAMGREDYALSCLENAMLMARRAQIELSDLPGMAERRSRLREMRGEAWRAQDALKSTLLLDPDKLHDAHSNHLVTLHRALSENDWRSVRVVQGSLAMLYQQAGRFPQAIGAAVLAEIHDEAVERAQKFAGRDAESARLAGESVVTLVLERGNSTGERYSVARVVSKLHDLIPDAYIEEVVQMLISWCEEEADSPHPELASVVLPFVGRVSERLPSQITNSALALARQVLDSPVESATSWDDNSRNAAIRFLSFVSRSIPEAEQSAWVTLAFDLVQSEQSSMAIGLLTDFALYLSAVSRERARLMLYDLAIQIGQLDSENATAREDTAGEFGEEEHNNSSSTSYRQRRAAHLYLQTDLGSLPNEIKIGLAQFHQERIASVIQKARGKVADGQITREFVLLNEGNLSSFDGVVDTFSPEQVEEISRGLLFLAELSEAMFPVRQDALASLTLLVPRLPESLRSEVARVARECASQLQIGTMQQWMHEGANDPFNRHKTAMGTPEGVQSFALDLVAQFCLHFDDGTLRPNISCLLDATSANDADVRAAAVCTLGVVQENMIEAEREDANLQILLSLQDVEDRVVSQANSAAARVASTASLQQAHSYLRCWNTIARQGSPAKQISTVRALQKVLTTAQQGETQFQPQDIVACLRLFEISPSYRARHIALYPEDD